LTLSVFTKRPAKSGEFKHNIVLNFCGNSLTFRGSYLQENVPFPSHEIHNLGDAIVTEFKRASSLFLSKYHATNHTFR